MAIKVDAFPDLPKPPNVPKNRKYFWEQWLDGDPWCLTPGEDFTVSVRIFRQNATAYARRCGFDLEFLEDKEKKLLYLRARKLDAPLPQSRPPKKKSAPGREKILSRSNRTSAARTEAPRVAEPPQPVDPVQIVFGDRRENAHAAGDAPPPPRSIPGVQFGEKAGRDW